MQTWPSKGLVLTSILGRIVLYVSTLDSLDNFHQCVIVDHWNGNGYAFLHCSILKETYRKITDGLRCTCLCFFWQVRIILGWILDGSHEASQL